MEIDTSFGDESVNRGRVTRLPLERLALLYEGVLTVIVRVQSGKQPIQRMDAFRERLKAVLSEVGRSAAQRGYTSDDITHANFAVVAFLDEAVLTSSESDRTQWARRTLQEEMFQQRSAGEMFFQRLDHLRANRDSPELIQVLEVYYLCLLLGYEGKYAAGSKAELYLLMDNLRERIERVAGRSVPFSPDAAIDTPKPSGEALTIIDPLANRARLIALGAAVFALLCFIACRILISVQTGDLYTLLTQSGRPGQ